MSANPSMLGPYPVERELGRGGMGVVYLARDPRLNRSVAIKVLPAELARHPDHLARFEREARHLASLNHPNIAAIYGVEDVEVPGPSDAHPERQRLLVLEYVPGQTLAERLKFGALPVVEALDVCRQIAQALEAAHDNGVVHRDLKPGNVAITPDGQVKVLDFGLAKGTSASTSDVDLALSPTFTYTPTAAGVILGTAGYMSPEQARGKPVDRRTDIWAFGCVLFECLTGRQFFQGETISDTIARILERDPDWSLLPPDTPARVRELLQARKRASSGCPLAAEMRRCELCSETRLTNATHVPSGHVVFSRGDTLHAASFDPQTMQKGDIVALTGGVRSSSSWAPGGFSLSRNGVLMYPPGARIGTDRKLVVIDAAGTLTPFVADRRSYETPPEVSPDGRRVAAVVANERGTYEIWIAERDRSTARAIAIPNADAASPVWSPDGRRLAYARQALGSDDGVYIERLDGSEPPRVMIKNESQQVFMSPASWAPDESGILVVRTEVGRDRLLFVPFAPGEAGTPRPLRHTRFSEDHGTFSRDGRMVAFRADDSGRMELYVAAYRDGALGPAVQVSRDLCGGVEWSADSRRVYFCDLADKLVFVTVQPEPLSVSAPVVVHDMRKLRLANWDLLPDGSVLGLQKGDGEDDITTVNVVLNWFDELRARMRR